MMASNYCFPILTLETCVTFMKEISNTLISEEDFKKPEPRRWQHFYGLIFEWMTGRQTEAIAQARVPALYANMEYSELHEESMSLMNFTLALQKALFSAGVTDFTIRDVFDPEPKRLLKIVSGAINFIRFRDSRIEVFESKKAELEKRREDFNFALKENTEKKKLLQARKEAHATQMLKMKQLQEENDAVSQRLQELHREREVKQRFLAELKKDLMEKTAAVDQFKVNILAAEAECEKLSQRIVQSPERVKAEQERAKNRIMGLKSTLTEHQKRMTELQRREEAMMAQLQHVQKAVRLLRDITNDCEKLAEIEKDTSCLQDSHQDLRTTSLNLSAKHDNLCQVLATRKDKLCTLDHQFDTKKAAMEEHLTQLSQLKSTLEGGMSSCESDKAQLITKKESIVDQVEQQKLKLQNQIECANSLYSEIVKQVDKLNVDVAKGLSEVRNILIHQK